MNRPLFVDGDVLVYLSAFACQKSRYHWRGTDFACHADFVTACKSLDLKWKDVTRNETVEKTIDVLPENVCLMIAKQRLDAVLEACGQTKDFLIFLTGPDNFRNDVAKTRGYKANRADAVKPIRFDVARDFFFDHKRSHVACNEEADDLLGIAMTESKGQGIIASSDKDLHCIPGRRYNWDTGDKYVVSPWHAHLWFMHQVLAGDSTDNIPGLPGMGPKTAMADLRGFTELRDMWQMVKTHYTAKYGEVDSPTRPATWQEYLDEQGQLIWIRRQAGEIWSAAYYEQEYVNV